MCAALVGLAACGRESPLNIGGPKGVTGDSTVATVRGAWVLETGEAPSAQIAVHIFCDRHANACTESIARISRGGAQPMLFANTNFWTVERWDTQGVEAVMDAPCVGWRLLIDFAAQQATEALTAKSISGPCAEYAKWKPTSFRLVDGTADLGER